MNSAAEQALSFRNMHVKGDPLILVNVWDAGSAVAIQSAGAKAIATGSWSVAAAHGSQDGEALPFELVIANLKRIAANVDLPVTVDIEGGYGRFVSEISENVQHTVESGAIGINLDDQIPGGAGLYSIQEQHLRLKAARDGADQTGVPLFINARTDVFLQTPPASHREWVADAIERAYAYEQAGADGLFVPGLQDPDCIRELCEQCALPVNIMLTSRKPTPAQLGELGVARVSYGPYPYQHMMEELSRFGQELLLHR